MRKTTLSRSLLLGAALALGTTTMTAQTASETPVNSPSDLTDGYYVIKATANNGAFSGLVYYNLNAGENRLFRVDKDKQSYTNGNLEAAYIWKLTNNNDADGTFKLKGMHDNQYIPADAEHNQNFRGTETANLKITEADGHWYVTMTNYQHADADTYWYANQPTGDPNLSWWQNYGGNQALQVEFYPVTELPEAVNVTFALNFNGETKRKVVYELFPDDTYPTVNLGSMPSYVSAPAIEGTVTAGVTTYNVDATFDGPFAISPAPEGGTFADGTTWYALGLHNAPYYLHDTDGAESMELGAGQQTIDASTNAAFDAQMWCFVGDPFDGFKLYNKAAGAGKILSSSTTMSGQNGGGTCPILVDETALPDGNNMTWDVTSSTNISGVNGFYIAQHGLASNCMNLRDGRLAYWTGGADDGSTFRVLNLQALYNAELGTYVSVSQSHPGYLGVLNPEVITGNQTTINALAGGTGTPENYVTLYNAFNNPEHTLTITDGGYYRLHCAPVRGNFVLSANAANMGLRGAAPSTSDASQIWKAVRTEDGKYKLITQGYAIGGENSLSLVDEAKAVTFYFGKNLTRDSQGDSHIIWFFDTTNSQSSNTGNSALNLVNQNNITLYPNNYGASAWMVEEVTSLDVAMNTVGDETWATLYLPFSVTTPEGVTAYTGTQKDENTVQLTAIEGGVIPAQTGVVLKGTATTCPLTLTNDAVAPVEGNIFTGTCLPISVTPETLENYYVLSTLEGVIGLYWPQEGTTALAANKAYIDNTPAAGAAGYRFVFGDNTTVGIDGVTLGQPDNTPYYDLSGRRIAQPAKGIYIHNGKKVFIK